MTLNTNIILPEISDLSLGEPKETKKYIKELVFSLESMYEKLAQGINGSIRGDTLEFNQRWTPIVKDTANPGTTFTYSNQTGWVYRNGIFVDIWFDINWTVNSGDITGNMFIELPYKVSVTNNKPFVGIVQPSVFTFTGGTACVVNAISDTYRAEIWNSGDAFTTANQASVAAGHLVGYIRYIGKQNE